MKSIIKIFLVLLILFNTQITVVFAQVDDAYAHLLEQHAIGEKEYKKLRNKLNKDLANIHNDTNFQKRLEQFYEESRKLTEKYRKPLVDQIIVDANSGLDKSKHVKSSQGSGLYKRDKTGRLVLNKAHRGWAGDFDFGGSAYAVGKVEKIIERLSTRSGISKESFPGYTDIKKLEITLNKGGSLGAPGSSAHQTQIIVDAASKETYVSAAMFDNQPGKKAVEIADHRKKAKKGLTIEHSLLLNSSDELQGLVKGTVKSAGPSGKEFLNNAELGKILKKNNINTDPETFRKKLELVKQMPELGPVAFKDMKPENLQSASREILDKSQKKADKIATEQIATEQNKARKMRNEVNSLAKQGRKKQADKIRKKVESREKLILDAKIRIQATRNALSEKRTKSNSHVETISQALSSEKNVYRFEGTSKKKIPPKIRNLGGSLGKVGGVYMKILDFKGNMEDFKLSINKALDAEKQGDSSLKTWVNSMKEIGWQASGVPAMMQAYKQVNETAKQRALEEIKNNPNLSNKDYDSLFSNYRNEGLSSLPAEIIKGALNEAKNLIPEAAKDLEEMTNPDLKLSLDRVNKMNDNIGIFRYRNHQLQRLKFIMGSLAVDGYDEDKSQERDKLINYFYDLRDKAEQRNNSTEIVQTQRWLEQIKGAKKELADVFRLQMEIKKEEERLAQEQRKLAEEKAKEARLSESWGDAWDDDSVSILAEDKIREEIRRKNDEYNANQSSIVSKDAKIRIDSISAEEKARAKRNREDWAAFARGMSKNSQSNTSAGNPMQDIMRDLARLKKEQNDKEYADYQNNINNTPIPANPYMVDPYWAKPSSPQPSYTKPSNPQSNYSKSSKRVKRYYKVQCYNTKDGRPYYNNTIEIQSTDKASETLDKISRRREKYISADITKSWRCNASWVKK